MYKYVPFCHNRNEFYPISSVHFFFYSDFFSLDFAVAGSALSHSELKSIRITNDAREDEMEDNMGQVNTMIGELYLINAVRFRIMQCTA